jgi:TIR domain-containing protein
MSPQQTPTVFLSHSHKDRRVARRLVRRLSAHGIKVWIDERELRLGSALTETLQAQIKAADALLVIASNASAVAKWVGLELECAKENNKDIIPIFIDPLSTHERFQDHLGIDATSPQGFADAVYDLMRDLFRSRDLELPPPNLNLLDVELRQIAREEPDLAPLIYGCLDSEGLHQDNIQTAYKAAFHPLDEALNALFDMKPNDSIAYHLASGFVLAGAATRPLALWIAKTGDGGLPLASAIGRRLNADLIPTAIKLLGACDNPNNQALYQFIHDNADQFDNAQRRAVLRLVTWPVRTDISRFGDVLGFVALENFPDALELQQMWSRWISSGAFDNRPDLLAHHLRDAHKKGLQGWDPVNEALRSHVRSYLRSGNKNKVYTAVDHIQAVAEKGAPVLSTLLREAEGVSGTAEWETWEEREPEAAEEMRWYVLAHAEEARGERKWSRARESAERTFAFEQERKRLLNSDNEADAATSG